MSEACDNAWMYSVKAYGLSQGIVVADGFECRGLPPGACRSGGRTVGILVRRRSRAAKRAILHCQTAHFATPYGPFCKWLWHSALYGEAKTAAQYGKTWWHRASCRSGPGAAAVCRCGQRHLAGKQKRMRKGSASAFAYGPCWLLPQAVRPRWFSAFRFCRGPGVCRRECLPRLRCPPTGVSGRARCRPPSAVRRTAGGGCGLPGGARRCAHRPRGSRC